MIDCDRCGFVYADVSGREIPNALLAFGPAYGARLRADPAVLRARPRPQTWSTLEYACHVRDVLDVQRERLALALAQDCPSFAPMGRDERAIRDRYNEQVPAGVADQLDRAARELADAFADLSEDQWNRTGVYNWPTATERTMVWLGQHTVHEGRHHLLDIDEGLARLAS